MVTGYDNILMVSSVIDTIKEKLDIVDIVGSYIKLDKAGMNFKARCPFHNEKTPSFYVSPDRQIWHCFGCGAGGDLFGFIKQIEGVEFPEALRMMASRAGVTLERTDTEFQSKKTKLFDVNEVAAKFFEKQLHESNAGKAVLRYLTEKRGMTEETIREWRLGYAPNSWNALKVFLKNVGYTEAEIHEAGLTARPSSGQGSGNSYDRFRGRIMFPITNIQGSVVGFTGRIFENEQHAVSDGEAKPLPSKAKYVNTPQTPIYDKSSILYGLDKGRLDVRSKDRCIAVEGNVDVILSHQAGVKNVIASSGTALTDRQIKMVKRYTENIDLCFDADLAGDTATRRGIDRALAQGMNVGVIVLDNEKDPADYVMSYGSKWAERAAQAMSVVDYYLQSAFKRFDASSARGKKEISSLVLPVIASIQNKVEQSHWVRTLSERLDVREDSLFQSMRAQASNAPYEYEKDAVSVQAQSSREILEEALLSLLVLRPELRTHVPESFHTALEHRAHRQIMTDMLRHKEGANGSSPDGPAAVSADALAFKRNVLHLKAQELWNGYPENQMPSECRRLIRSIQRDNIKKELLLIQNKLRIADKDRSDTKELLTRLHALTRDLHALDNSEAPEKKIKDTNPPAAPPASSAGSAAQAA